LHLNLPGAPDGAAFSADAVMSAIATGRKRLGPEPGRTYSAFVDMSGGSSDDAQSEDRKRASQRAPYDHTVRSDSTRPAN
jgi:hypothetical protein